MSSFSYDSAAQRNPLGVLRDLVRARYLLRDLAWKDLRVRYRYTAMGFLWAVLQPLALMVVLSFIFTVVFPTRLPEATTSAPFAVVILCGLIFWQFFAAGVAGATRAITDNQHLVKKVHFAREVLPLAAVVYPAVNLAIGFVLLIALHLAFGGSPGLAWAWLIPICTIQLLLMVGLGLLCSAGHVYYQDVGFMVDVALLFGFYASPVFYPLEFVMNNDAVPGIVQNLYLLNPMAGLLGAYRAAFLDHSLALHLLVWPGICSLFLLVAGVYLFRRCSPTFSDRL